MIHESLSDIMKSLRRLENKSGFTSNPVAETPDSANVSPYIAQVFEGESSFTRHSEQATLSAEISAAGPESIQTV